MTLVASTGSIFDFPYTCKKYLLVDLRVKLFPC